MWKHVQIWLSCKLDKSKSMIKISKKHVLICNEWDCKKRNIIIKQKILLVKFWKKMILFYCMTCRMWFHTWQSWRWSFDEMTYIVFERWFLIKTHIFLKSWMKQWWKVLFMTTGWRNFDCEIHDLIFWKIMKHLRMMIKILILMYWRQKTMIKIEYQMRKNSQ